MKVYETHFSHIYEVTCEHPDHGIEHHTFVVDDMDISIYDIIGNDEVALEYNQTVRKLIENKVNYSGFWHEVHITDIYLTSNPVDNPKEPYIILGKKEI